jgi:exonuclease V
MATPISKVTPHDVHSDYGSDIELHTPTASEYGSEFDPEEETLIGDLLESIASTAPALKLERTFVYTEIEEGQQDAVPTVFVHSSPPSAVVRLQKGASVELSAGREQTEHGPSVEVEYDKTSKEISKGMIHFVSRLHACDFMD